MPKKTYVPSITISKIDESYNTDKAPDTLTSKDDFGEYKNEKKNYLQDIPSENASVYTSTKVRKNIFSIININNYSQIILLIKTMQIIKLRQVHVY